MSQQEKLNLTSELNGSDRNLLLCEEGILKGVNSNILRSKYGEFTFGSFYDPISDTLGNCLIDLENEYTPGLAKSLIDETLKVDPGSNYLRLRAPEFQSSEVQELINSYLADRLPDLYVQVDDEIATFPFISVGEVQPIKQESKHFEHLYP